MLVFIERRERDGFQLLTGDDTYERVTEETMNQMLSAERPENSPIPAIIHMPNSRPEIEAKTATVEQRRIG